MILLVILVFCFLCFASVCFRLTVLHLFGTVRNGLRDLYFYFMHKEYNRQKTGELLCYCGLFGKGKTLSDVEKVVYHIYEKKNDRVVWCSVRKKFVKQRVMILSNVDLNVPYVPFTSLQQIVDVSSQNARYDLASDTYTVCIVLGDEFSVQLNSRSFKSNISPLFLNTLLTCRHYHLSIYYTAQRFQQVDALLRQVTQYVIECNKIWRYQVQYIYNAWELENATNALMLKPIRRTGFFVFDKHYHAYDTLACVANLTKAVEECDMLTDEEILARQSNNFVGVDAVSRPSRKLKKIRKH